MGLMAKSGVRTATLAGTDVITSADFQIQRLNPNGSDRTIKVKPQHRGFAMFFVNTGTTVGATLDIVDRDDSAVISLNAGEVGLIAGTGGGLVHVPIKSGTIDGITLGDNDLLTLGTGADFTATHDGTDTILDSVNATAKLKLRLGTDTSATSLVVEQDGGNDLLTITGDGQHAAYVKDDSTTAWSVNEAGNPYIAVDTSNAGALVKLGNATTNPQVQMLGTGGATVGGSLTIGADTVLSRGAADRLDLAAGDTLRTLGLLETVDDVSSGTARRVGGFLSRSSALGTSHTNSTDETALAVTTIPANTIKAGTLVRVHFKARVTAETGATTLTCYLRLTSTAAGTGGTALITSSAVNADVGHVFHGSYVLNGHAAPGAAASIVGYGQFADVGASPGGTITSANLPTGTTFATNAALYLALTADWSAADANSVQAEIFAVEIIG